MDVYLGDPFLNNRSAKLEASEHDAPSGHVSAKWFAYSVEGGSRERGLVNPDS
jgi:hypothetical protein